MCWVHSCIHLNRMFRSGFWFHTPTALLLHSLVSSQTAILWTPHSMASSWLFAFCVLLPLVGFPSVLCLPGETLLILQNSIQKSPSDLYSPISHPELGAPPLCCSSLVFITSMRNHTTLDSNYLFLCFPTRWASLFLRPVTVSFSVFSVFYFFYYSQNRVWYMADIVNR